MSMGIPNVDEKTPTGSRLVAQGRLRSGRPWVLGQCVQSTPTGLRPVATPLGLILYIDYIHRNPLRRGLVNEATHWKWSSARWYASERQLVDPDLPMIHGLPPEFFV